MMVLHLVDADDGTVLDTITLGQDGRLRYETGAARDVAEAARQRTSDGGDRAVFDALHGWSNGYVAIRPAP